MSDIQSQLADIVLEISKDESVAFEASNAIIAALPDMVKPLKWSRLGPTAQLSTSCLGNSYTVWSVDGAAFLCINGDEVDYSFRGGISDLKKLAQVHHTARTLSALGIATEAAQ